MVELYSLQRRVLGRLGYVCVAMLSHIGPLPVVLVYRGVCDAAGSPFNSPKYFATTESDSLRKAGLAFLILSILAAALGCVWGMFALCSGNFDRGYSIIRGQALLSGGPILHWHICTCCRACLAPLPTDHCQWSAALFGASFVLCVILCVLQHCSR